MELPIIAPMFPTSLNDQICGKCGLNGMRDAVALGPGVYAKAKQPAGTLI